MSIVLLIVMLILFFYINTLFYSIALLFMVVSLVYILFSHALLHSLTGLMFLIVYVGAMIILIGYICAVCPNLILSSSGMSFYPFAFVLSASFLSFGLSVFSPGSTFSPLVAFFYSSLGMSSFVTLVFMLFVTLLMVTTQYMVPKGPFRSVSV